MGRGPESWGDLGGQRRFRAAGGRRGGRRCRYTLGGSTKPRLSFLTALLPSPPPTHTRNQMSRNVRPLIRTGRAHCQETGHFRPRGFAEKGPGRHPDPSLRPGRTDLPCKSSALPLPPGACRTSPGRRWPCAGPTGGASLRLPESRTRSLCGCGNSPRTRVSLITAAAETARTGASLPRPDGQAGPRRACGLNQGPVWLGCWSHTEDPGTAALRGRVIPPRRRGLSWAPSRPAGGRTVCPALARERPRRPSGGVSGTARPVRGLRDRRVQSKRRGCPKRKGGEGARPKQEPSPGLYSFSLPRSGRPAGCRSRKFRGTGYCTRGQGSA